MKSLQFQIQIQLQPFTNTNTNCTFTDLYKLLFHNLNPQQKSHPIVKQTRGGKCCSERRRGDIVQQESVDIVDFVDIMDIRFVLLILWRHCVILLIYQQY